MTLTRRAAILTTLGLTGAAMTSDDLTDLFTTPPPTLATPMRYLQGTIQTWNPTTLENTVRVGRTTLTNLTVLGAAEAASYREGTTVGIALIDSTWAIIGRFVIPNTADAQDAITQIGQRALTATVLTAEDTASASFVDLATIGPQLTGVLIPASGKVEVTISAQIDSATSSPPFGAVGVAVSGATTIAASTQQSLLIGNAALNGTRTLLFTGLPAGGRCNFKLMYLAGGGITARFSNRDIIVRAL